MSFTYPMGLLGLIGIPVLIILYIIKSHYAEQTVASVYLWKLSEKFLKKKRRLRFGGLLSLLLQILAVIAISMTIAGPVIVLPDAANDYCFVLDASGSMTAQCEQKTRFEVGKERIRTLIEESEDGSTYSLILAGTTAFEAYAGETDREVALTMLDSLQCDWTDASCADALSIAQSYYTADHSPLTYLVTDKAYQTENINLINVSESEENYAFVSYGFTKQVPMLTVSGQVISYDRDAEITIELYVDDKKCAQTVVNATRLMPCDFSVETECESFSALRLEIANQDALMLDNQGVLYSTGETENNKTLLVSDAPAYLEYVLRASGKTSVDVVATGKYSQNSESYTGYGLYIFDSFSDPDKLPQSLPKNATVWLINPTKSIQGAGFGFREIVEAEGTLGSSSQTGDEKENPTDASGTDADADNQDEQQEKENRFEPTYTTSTSSFVKTLTKGLLGQTISVKKYARYIPDRNYTGLLNVGSDSLLFVGNNENGDRQVVFAFDLHDSDLPLQADYLILMNNLLTYSFPAVIEQTLYTVGDHATVNVPAGCTDMLLQAPSGKTVYPDFSSSYAYLSLEQAGTYHLTAMVNGEEREYYLFAQLPATESYEIAEESARMQMQSDSTVSDGFYDKLIWYFIILALAFVLDWGVYCYEQYQLR